MAFEQRAASLHFVDPAIEEQFRSSFASRHRNRLALVFACAGLLWLAGGLADSLAMGHPDNLFAMRLTRFGIMVPSAVIAVVWILLARKAGTSAGSAPRSMCSTR